ncbi:MAG: type II toxin-antitoxin system VapC family toxin [Sporichthyaceae bacterium]
MTSPVLLDTHVLVWLIASPHRIRKTTMARLNDIETAMFVSAATAFELSSKARTGRWPDAAQIVDNYSSALLRVGAQKLDVTSDHSLAAGGLDWQHGDPFDRLLVAQAQAEGLTLVTKDRVIRAFGAVPTMW